MEIIEGMTTKDMTEDDIDILTDAQLYNILYGPAIEAYEKYKMLIQKDKERSDEGKENEFETPNVPLVVTGNHFEWKAAKKISTLISLFNTIQKYKHELVIFSGGKSFFITNPELTDTVRANRYDAKFQEWINYFEGIKKLQEEGKIDSDFKGIDEYYCEKKGVNINNTDEVKKMIMNLSEAEMMYYLFEEIGMNKFGAEKIKTVLLEDEADTTPKNIINSYRLIEYSKENTNPNIDVTKMAIMSLWEHLSRTVLTAKQFNPELEIYGIPSTEMVVTDLEEFRKIAKREIRKFVEYRDVAPIDAKSLRRILAMPNCDNRGPNVKDKDGNYLIGPEANRENLNNGPRNDEDGR